MTTTEHDYHRDNYPYNEYSTECYDEQGVNCDALACLCPCHGPYAPDFVTVEDVIEWHDPQWIKDAQAAEQA